MPKAILSYGLSASGTINLLQKKRGEPTYFLGCYEEFSDGPLLPINDLTEFAKRRIEYWRKTGIRAGLQKWLADIERDRATLAKAGSIEIWVGTGVQEQLFLITTLALLQHLNFDLHKIKLAQFPEIENRPTLGEYTLDMLADGPTATYLDQSSISLYQNAWEAISYPTPEKFISLVHSGSGSPILDKAIGVFLSRYPDLSSGLGSIEKHLLAAIPEGWKKAAYIVGTAMAYSNWLDSVGDLTLFNRLMRLGDQGLPAPAVEIRGNPRKMRHCEVRITEFGRECLAGRQNYVLTNGIEDWVGGVHLNSGSGAVWFREGQTLVPQ